MNPRILLLLTMLAGWMNRNQQRVIEYLQEENRVLRELHGNRRLKFTDRQRARLARKGKALGWASLQQAATLVTPQTILSWHRKLIARKYDGTGKRGPSRRALRMREVTELASRMPQENSGWGYRRIQGGLKHLGLEVSHATVYNILRRNGLDPSPKRGVESNWQRFIRSHMEVLGAMDFLTVESRPRHCSNL